MLKPMTLDCGPYALEVGSRTLIMGIVNVTPDSFSDGGHFFDKEAAVFQGLKLAAEGADILDIGGESTRPFSEPVPVLEEIDRVVPVIRELASQVSIPISVDTAKAAVAEKAIEAGATMVNDITALRGDPLMAGVVAEAGLPVILMHMQGSPKNMQVAPTYADLFTEITNFFRERIAHTSANGIPHAKIVIDPGIGFGKTFHHNLTLINHLDRFAALGTPILVGSSRKAFIRQLLKDKDDIRPDHPMVEIGTQATVTVAIQKGAHIVRVHEVANTRATVTIVDAIRKADGE
jgi:dihydropteroate synthase